MGKLTELQLTTLRLIRDGKVLQINCGYGAWRILGASPTVVGRLLSMKLAEWHRVYPETFSADLTAAGRAALSPENGGENHG